MAPPPEIDDMLALTRKYYSRLRELLAEAPDGALDSRVAAEGLTVAETIRHVCQAELWYMNLVDGRAREPAEVPPDEDGLADLLRRTEADMAGFIEAATDDVLSSTRDVPTWWGEGDERSARLVLMHSLAHKYYHCGQLQSILHSLTTEAE